MTRKLDSRTPATKEDVLRLFRDVPDWKTARIVAAGATREDLEAALLWIQGESDIAGDARRPLAGRAALVYDIVMADVPEEDD